MEYKRLSKKAKESMYISTAIVTVILSIMAIVGYNMAFKHIIPEYMPLGQTILCIIEVVLVLNLIIAPSIRYKRYKYLINAEKLEVIEGIIFIKRSIVPIERLHKISIEKGPIDRMFALGKVIVTTAGGEVVIGFLEEKEADEIAEHLKTKINQIVKDKRKEDKNV